ncbi:hypothetical protein BY458DRAFT_513831, partial [Sporodiniella umbellata]
MNLNGRLNIRTRKSVRGNGENLLVKKVVSVETDKAFIPSEVITVEENKLKLVKMTTRATQQKRLQSIAPIEKENSKRKLSPQDALPNKKQKAIIDTTNENKIASSKQETDLLTKNELETESVPLEKPKSNENTENESLYNSHLLSPPHQSSLEEKLDDTLSAAQRHVEPITPPSNSQRYHQSVSEASFREYVSLADKLRMEDEQNTLEKLQKVLDIVLTDRASRNIPALYSQIESPLRNSTRKSITITHILKVMYVAPKLYAMQAKEIRRFGNKTFEDYLIEFESSWSLPLSPKDYVTRKEAVHNGLKTYFETNMKPDATVPEVALPKLSTVIDKKEWMKDAKLPPGVRSLLEAHSKVKEEKIESQTPKPTPKGSVKDRMAALRARLANKK